MTRLQRLHFARSAPTIVIALASCATTAPAALPTTALAVVPQPALQERLDAAPPVPPSRVALPLELELGWLLPLVTQAAQRDLQLAQKDWTRVTGAGANPEVETRMQASLGELQVSVGKDVVRVLVPVAYWGTVRARASTPFGSVWLSKGSEWGTREAPGLVTLEVELRPRIDRAFKLSTKTSLGELRFEAPRGDKLCTTTLVRICISREAAAAHVHQELERAIRKAAPALLKAVDARIAERGDLRSFIAQALETMATASGPEQLGVHVSELAVGPFSGEGTRLRVTTELALTVSTGDPAKRAPSVPPKTELRGGAGELHFDFVVPLAALGEHWTRQLATAKVGDWDFASCEVLGFEAGGQGLVVSVALTREAQSVKVFASAALETRDAALRLTSVQLSPASAETLVRLEVDATQVVTALRGAQPLGLEEHAARQLRQIEQKLGALTLGLSPVALALTAPVFEATGAASAGLRFRAHSSAGVTPAAQ